MCDQWCPPGKNSDQQGADRDDRKRQNEQHQRRYALTDSHDSPTGMAFKYSSTEDWNRSQCDTWTDLTPPDKPSLRGRVNML